MSFIAPIGPVANLVKKLLDMFFPNSKENRARKQDKANKKWDRMEKRIEKKRKKRLKEFQ